ncbi:MAG: peptidoglycan DD-metalloendopeptidase family protein [Dokdonella sp.]
MKFVLPKWMLLGAIVAAALLAACASTPPAPVVDRGLSSRPATTARSTPARGVYRVQRGDTLYSIAFRNGYDYRDLARRNGINAPYTIYVGQEIRLDDGTRPVVAARPASAPPGNPVASTPAPSPRNTAPVLSPSPAASAAQPAQSLAVTPAPTSSAAASKPASTPPPAPGSGGSVGWSWPAEGKRVAGFINGDQTRQGIDIAGKAGDPIKAAADGEVVYSGNGLIGYGELIIIKHSSSLLSAYGHNRRRLVQEGARVKAGQQIAEMGSSSASRDMLHFEIRRNGKPVDPMSFLPAR